MWGGREGATSSFNLLQDGHHLKKVLGEEAAPTTTSHEAPHAAPNQEPDYRPAGVNADCSKKDQPEGQSVVIFKIA